MCLPSLLVTSLLIGLWRNARALGSMRMVWIGVVTLVAAALATMPAEAADLGPVQGGALPGPLPLLPPDNWWNVDISGAPVDAGVRGVHHVHQQRRHRRLHPDFGGDVSPDGPTYGMPYAVVDGTQPKLTVDFVLTRTRATASACRSIRSPTTRPSPSRTGSRAARRGMSTDAGPVGPAPPHRRPRPQLALRALQRLLQRADRDGDAGSGAFFDMNTNDRRPDGWTSADAAGLAILPGLVRYDEVYDPGVPRSGHAFRVTVRADERLRVSGVARRRLDPGRAVADGRAAAAQGGPERRAVRPGGCHRSSAP